MYQKLKKIPKYGLKFLKQGKLKELYLILHYVPLKFVPVALAARLDRRPHLIPLKKGWDNQEINLFLDILPHQGKQVTANLHEWKVGKRKFYANYTQFVGLYLEYLKGVFNDIYAFDWQGKRVLDIGGFIGDSALYFLENGARHVVIYEPLAENIEALNLNLKSYQKHISIHQHAIAEHSGPFYLSSSLPIGSPGFGIEKGEYQRLCQGITIQEVLKQHHVDVAKIDCEGGEQYLTSVDSSQMRAIPYWIVETHHPDIYTQVIQKFETCGFTKLRDISLSPIVNLLHFKLTDI